MCSSSECGRGYELVCVNSFSSFPSHAIISSLFWLYQCLSHVSVMPAERFSVARGLLHQRGCHDTDICGSSLVYLKDRILPYACRSLINSTEVAKFQVYVLGYMHHEFLMSVLSEVCIPGEVKECKCLSAKCRMPPAPPLSAHFLLQLPTHFYKSERSQLHSN